MMEDIVHPLITPELYHASGGNAHRYSWIDNEGWAVSHTHRPYSEEIGVSQSLIF